MWQKTKDTVIYYAEMYIIVAIIILLLVWESLVPTRLYEWSRRKLREYVDSDENQTKTTK